MKAARSVHRPPSRARILSRSRPVQETEEQSYASFRQAKSLMQAGISSILAGHEEDALMFFQVAEHRFEGLHENLDAGIARAWILGLKSQDPR